MRGNGDGHTVNTLTGDHLNRPTDYTPVAFQAFRPTGGTRSVDAGPQSPSLKVGSGLGIPSPPAVFHASDYGTGRGTPVVNGVPDIVGTLSDGAHYDGGLNGQDAYTGRIFPHTQSIPRRLTPVECSRLQGFPDDWNEWGIDENGERIDLADSPRYRQFGNAVTVNVAHWIGQRIMAVVVQEGGGRS